MGTKKEVNGVSQLKGVLIVWSLALPMVYGVASNNDILLTVFSIIAMVFIAIGSIGCIHNMVGLYTIAYMNQLDKYADTSIEDEHEYNLYLLDALKRYKTYKAAKNSIVLKVLARAAAVAIILSLYSGEKYMGAGAGVFMIVGMVSLKYMTISVIESNKLV